MTIEEKYDKSVDVYAFGMLVYHLLTGVIPFHEIDNTYKLSKKVKKNYQSTMEETKKLGY